MAVLNLKGIQQPHGKLTAIKFIEVDQDRGAIWECQCACGGTRNVPTKYFNTRRGGIKSCIACTDPKRRALQAMLGKRMGNEWASEDFDVSWISYITKFDPTQRLLFETAANNRYRDQILKEAADLVLRSGNLKEELIEYDIERVESAVFRLQINYNGRRRSQ